MAHRGRNWHGISERWLWQGADLTMNYGSAWRNDTGAVGHEAKELWRQVQEKQVTDFPQLNTLIGIFLAHFLAIGWTQHRSLLTKVCRKLSNMFNLGRFLFLSKISQVKGFEGQGERAGKIQHSFVNRENLGLAASQLSYHSSPGRFFLYWNLWIMPLIYGVFPLLNVEKDVTGGSAKASPHPSLISLAFFNRSEWATSCVFRAETSAEGQVSNFAVFGLTASLCKLWLNTVYVVTVENILLTDI